MAWWWKNNTTVEQLKEYVDKLVAENKGKSIVTLRTNSEDVDKYFSSLQLNFENDSLIVDFDINEFEDVIGK